jgi:hypothetical protein
MELKMSIRSDADSFVFADLKPTESANIIIVDGFAVDPHNPNVDPPDPDHEVGVPAVQTDDGLLLPAVQHDGLEWPIGPIPEMHHGLLLPY